MINNNNKMVGVYFIVLQYSNKTPGIEKKLSFEAPKEILPSPKFCSKIEEVPVNLVKKIHVITLKNSNNERIIPDLGGIGKDPMHSKSIYLLYSTVKVN